jgi:hypothetical protein
MPGVEVVSGAGGGEGAVFTVDQGHVQRDQHENRFQRQHFKRSKKIVVCNLLQIHLFFIGLCVNRPVLRLVSQRLGLPLQQHRGVSFRNDDEANRAEESSHDESDPLRPTPTQMAHSDEASHNRTHRRTDKSRGSEQRKRHTSLNRIEEISQRAPNDSQGSAGKEATEEAADEDRLKVRGHGDGDLENRKYNISGEEGDFAAVEFAERSLSTHNPLVSAPLSGEFGEWKSACLPKR